jgi:hypothetical protein
MLCGRMARAVVTVSSHEKSLNEPDQKYLEGETRKLTGFAFTIFESLHDDFVDPSPRGG